MLIPLSGGPNAHHQAYAVMYNILRQQASLWSYVDMFRLLVIVCLICIPVVRLFKKVQGPSPAAPTRLRETVTQI
jgi:DHA2 family multidrug resistance protein